MEVHASDFDLVSELNYKIFKEAVVHVKQRKYKRLTAFSLDVLSILALLVVAKLFAPDETSILALVALICISGFLLVSSLYHNSSTKSDVSDLDS